VLSFTQFVEERSVDPVRLAQRTARRYGKRKSFGKWEKVQKGGHIPLSGYDGRKVAAVSARHAGVEERSSPTAFKDAHTATRMRISDLKPTQKYVETHDTDKLSRKIHNLSPDHIQVVTHKGEHYIADGHHAVMAAKMRGDTHVDVTHVDLDKFPKR